MATLSITSNTNIALETTSSLSFDTESQLNYSQSIAMIAGMRSALAVLILVAVATATMEQGDKSKGPKVTEKVRKAHPLPRGK